MHNHIISKATTTYKETYLTNFLHKPNNKNKRMEFITIKLL